MVLYSKIIMHSRNNTTDAAVMMMVFVVHMVVVVVGQLSYDKMSYYTSLVWIWLSILIRWIIITSIIMIEVSYN